MIISLDTNIILFGINRQRPAPILIMDSLRLFSVKLSRQVEKEVRRNLDPSGNREFYTLLNALPSVEISYDEPPALLIAQYKQWLKGGDIEIAAFCEWQAIDLFVSENRHFLRTIPALPFEVLDSMQFCDRFQLSA